MNNYLSTIKLSSNDGVSLKLADSDEIVTEYDIPSSNLVQTFDLVLEVGLIRHGRFIRLDPDAELQIGETIRVRLMSSPTKFV